MSAPKKTIKATKRPAHAAAPLLVEILCEELPPLSLHTLGEVFAQKFFEHLQKLRLLPEGAGAQAFATPRRLAVLVSAALPKAPDEAREIVLMPAAIGLDADGKATAPLLRRLEQNGESAAAVSRLLRRAGKNGDDLILPQRKSGIALKAGAQMALDAALAALPIPRAMAYPLADGWQVAHFARPMHGLLALHGANVLPLVALGHKAARITRGHRTLAGTAPLSLARAEDYAATLQKKGKVIADFEGRKAIIAAQLQSVARAHKLHLQADEALLQEVTALCEWPVVLAAQFEAQFLELPAECLILTMRTHQRYFALRDAQGRLSNRFLFVANQQLRNPDSIIAGNERVIRPRLEDARFFLQQDLKTPLEQRLERLSGVAYHAQLGSQRERAERIETLALSLGRALLDAENLAPLQSAAHLAKADLTCEMTGEFPELQGEIGAHVARAQGLDARAALAIAEQYRPRFAGDALPQSAAGSVLALADKLHTLAGFFAIGRAPSGDKDPFALRRAALGVVRLITEKSLEIEITPWLQEALAPFAAQCAQYAPDATAKLCAFMQERLRNTLIDGGADARDVAALLGAEQAAHWAQMPAMLQALAQFRQSEAGAALAAANKRITNILKKSAQAVGAVDAALLHQEAERALHTALLAELPRAQECLAARDYAGYLARLARLRPAVDAFFDGVMVNDADAALRANRLALLTLLAQAMNAFARLELLAPVPIMVNNASNEKSAPHP